MNEYKNLFKNRNFSLLFFSQILSQSADRLQQMAYIKLVFDMTGGEASESAMGLAKLISFTIIPFFVIGPVAGTYVDRWDRRKILYLCDYGKMVLMILIPLLFVNFDSMIPIYSIIFLTYTLSRFYVPAKLALIPDLVQKEELLTANSLKTTTGVIAFVIGTLTGGIMVEQLGFRIGFMATSVIYGCAATLLFLISKASGKVHLINQSSENNSVIQDLKDGYQYVTQHKEIRFILWMMFYLLAASGAIYIVFIVLVQEAFGTATQDLGILATAGGIGLFLGALLYGKFGKKWKWDKAVFVCLILTGIAVALFAYTMSIYPTYIICAPLSLLVGLLIGPIFIAANTVAHIVSDQEMRGKLFTALEVVIHLGFLLTMFISSYIAKFVAPALIVITVGILISIAGVIGLQKDRSNVDFETGTQHS